MGLNVKSKIIKFLEANIGEKSLKAWVKQDFLDRKSTKQKHDQLNFIKIRISPF